MNEYIRISEYSLHIGTVIGVVSLVIFGVTAATGGANGFMVFVWVVVSSL